MSESPQTKIKTIGGDNNEYKGEQQSALEDENPNEDRYYDVESVEETVIPPTHS